MLSWMCLLIPWLAASGAGHMTKEEALERAKDLVAAREEVERETLRVRRVDAVEWPDASLDCPETGKTYPEVLTRGFRVLLQADRTLYRVHVAEGRAAICGEPLGRPKLRKAEKPLPEKPPPRQESVVTGEVSGPILDRIREDLVRRIGADPAAIEILRTEATVFSDGSLGCAKPGEVYIQVLTPGYHVVLGHEGRTYDYRATETGHFVLCEGPLAPAVPVR